MGNRTGWGKGGRAGEREEGQGKGVGHPWLKS